MLEEEFDHFRVNLSLDTFPVSGHVHKDTRISKRFEMLVKLYSLTVHD